MNIPLLILGIIVAIAGAVIWWPIVIVGIVVVIMGLVLGKKTKIKDAPGEFKDKVVDVVKK